MFEETEGYVITQDEYGVKKKLNKVQAATPEFIGWPIETREDFERLKAERFQPILEQRIPEHWPRLIQEYQHRDYPLALGGYPFGFYGFLRYLMGEQRLLVNFYDDPQLVKDIMSFLADFWINLWNQVLDVITPDCANF